MTFSFQPVSACIGLCLAFSSSTLFAQTAPETLADADTALLQRIAQYEFLLDSKLTTNIGLCVDELMGELQVVPSDPTVEVQQSVLDKVRRSSETCAVATNGGNSRLVAGLRRQLDERLALAVQLENAHTSSQSCLIASTSSEGLKTCLTNAIGKAPSVFDWRYWVGIFERKSNH